MLQYSTGKLAINGRNKCNGVVLIFEFPITMLLQIERGFSAGLMVYWNHMMLEKPKRWVDPDRTPQIGEDIYFLAFFVKRGSTEISLSRIDNNSLKLEREVQYSEITLEAFLVSQPNTYLNTLIDWYCLQWFNQSHLRGSARLKLILPIVKYNDQMFVNWIHSRSIGMQRASKFYGENTN